MLDGDTKVKFETIAKAKTTSTGVDLQGKELSVTGETDATFQATYIFFVNSFYTHHDLTKQLNYLRGCIKYPGHWNPPIKLEEFVRRRKSINSKL